MVVTFNPLDIRLIHWIFDCNFMPVLLFLWSLSLNSWSFACKSTDLTFLSAGTKRVVSLTRNLHFQSLMHSRSGSPQPGVPSPTTLKDLAVTAGATCLQETSIPDNFVCDVQIRGAKAGVLSEELRRALGMGETSPPPWLINMQRYGLPPSYPDLKVRPCAP